jgi:maltose-binding protein MalE
MRRFTTLSLLLALTLSACGTLIPPVTPSPTPPPTLTPTPEPAVTAPPVPTPGGPRTLVIWLPPEFDPDGGTAAGNLLRSRLDQFAAEYPEITITIRLKAANGPSDLLESLTAASQAAPASLPDLIALPRPDLEAAAALSLLRPLDGLTTVLDEPDWYAFASQMAHIQNTAYGLPFAADALLLAYHPSQVSLDANAGWTQIRDLGASLAFPADDPQALVSLGLYLSSGGALVNAEGQPSLDPAGVETLFEFFAQASASGLMPVTDTQFQTDAQSWQAYREGRAALSVTWASQVLAEASPDTSLLPLPGLDSQPFALATGWAWAVTSSDAGQQALASRLAEFLVDSTFLAEWTAAAGYLPPRPNSLPLWKDRSSQVLAARVLESAQLIPSQDLLLVLGPVMQEAVVGILQGKITASEAVQAVIEELK